MAERCGQCGLPRYICQNESEEIQFRIDQEACAAMQAKDRYENPPGGKKREIKAGTEVKPMPYSTEGKDLSTYRGAYYTAEAKKREARDLATNRP